MGNSNSTALDAKTLNGILYTAEGKKCCFDEAGRFKWRLRQIEIMNRAILLLSDELSKQDSQIDFQGVSQDILSYTDISGNQPPSHDWTIVASDISLQSRSELQNKFAEFEQYFDQNVLKGPSDIKKDFEDYLTAFILSRDFLIRSLMTGCK